MGPGRVGLRSWGSTKSKGASLNGKLFPAVYEVGMRPISVLSWSTDQVSGDEMLLAMLSWRSMAGTIISVVFPSHFIQSSHSSMSIPSLKAFSKTLFSGLMYARGVMRFALSPSTPMYKCLKGIVR